VYRREGGKRCIVAREEALWRAEVIAEAIDFREVHASFSYS
jgi:hypothetical protein